MRGQRIETPTTEYVTVAQGPDGYTNEAMTLKGLLLRELSEGHTEASLAKAIGIPQKTIDCILAGVLPEDTDVWKKSAIYFRMDMDFLRYGELKDSVSHGEFLSAKPTTEVDPFRPIPMISWKRIAQMTNNGAPAEANQIEGMIETDVHGEHIFAVRVQDDSMEPLFHPEEIVFVNPDLHVERDQYAIVIDQDSQEATIRQIREVGEDILLHTLNPKYHDTPFMKQHRIVGRVVRLRMNL